MVLTAFYLPGVGLFIKTYKVLNIVIFLGFLTTGLTLDTSSILEQLKNVRVLLAALISSLFLFPVIAYFLAGFFFKAPPDVAVGALIIGIAPATIASGTVMTAMALGNIPLSLFICVLTNFASLLTIPFLLSQLLQYTGTSVDLPITNMLISLAMKVLLPTLIGQVLRPYMASFIAPYKKQISIFNQVIVLMIVLNAVSSAADRTPGIRHYHRVDICVHVRPARVDPGHQFRAVPPHPPGPSVHGSLHHSHFPENPHHQYLVWAGHFYHSHPMALIPPIVYHLTQSIVDTWVAHRFRKVAER